MSRTSNKLLLGVLASMMVWLLVGADELDLAKQQDRAGFGPAARQVVDAQALQSVGARCRAETDAAVAAAVAATCAGTTCRRSSPAVGGVPSPERITAAPMPPSDLGRNQAKPSA